MTGEPGSDAPRPRAPAPPESTPESTDVAALAGSVVAVVLTVFSEVGPYDWVGVYISAALLLFVAAYVLPKLEGTLKTAAIATIVGILSIPISGFVLEQFVGPWTDCHQWVLNDVIEASKAGAPPSNAVCGNVVAADVTALASRSEPDSAVKAEASAIASLAVAVLFFLWRWRVWR
jgi:putative methionine-R-sulfoxide reductase with GAF domain